MAVGESTSLTADPAAWVTTPFRGPSGLTASNNIITSEDEIDGNIGIPYQGQVKASYMGEGDIPMGLRPGGVNPLLMKAFLGSVSTVDEGGGAYTHTYSLASICDDLPIISVYMDKLSQKIIWNGVRVSALSVNQVVGDFGTMDWTTIGRKDKEASAPVVTEYSAKRMGPADLTVTMNGVALGPQSISFSMSNGLESDYELNGSMFPTGHSATTFGINGAFERKFINTLLQKRFWGSTVATEPSENIMDNTLTLEWVSTEQIAASGVYYTIKFEFKNITILTAQPQLAAKGSKLIEPFTFNATQDASGDLLTVTIKNSESSIGI